MRHLPKRAAVLALLMIGAAAALAWQAWVVGVTYDEPYHLAAGYRYWRGEQPELFGETPPLIGMVSGWVPHVLGLSMTRIHDESRMGDMALQQLPGDRARRIIFFTRLTLMVFPLLTAGLVWVWGRQMFGERVALWLVAAALLEPNLLAHGLLIKSDVPATFGLVWCAYSCWSFWRRPDLRRAALLALSLAVAVLTKFTLLLMIPFVAVVAAARYLLRRDLKAAAAALAAVLLAPYLSLIVAYQFHAVRDRGDLRSRMHWDQVWDQEDVAVLRVQRFVPLPPSFVRGVRFVSYFNRVESMPSYMLGKRIESGAPGYYPLALAIKYPIALQLLLAAGLAVLARRLQRRQAGSDDFFVWVPAILIFGLAIRSHVHIGFRHMLPCLPFFLLGGGRALEWLLARRAGRLAAAGGLIWLAVASFHIYPHGISYFNEWIGGPNQGWKYLADSNLDWGQDLPWLGAYLKNRGSPEIKLSYFGPDLTPHYLARGSYEDLTTPWCIPCVHEKVLRPEPGLYAISVNIMLGYFFEPGYRDYFRYFREREPEAKAGYSIFIYRVPPRESRQGPGGDPAGAETPRRGHRCIFLLPPLK